MAIILLKMVKVLIPSSPIDLVAVTEAKNTQTHLLLLMEMGKQFLISPTRHEHVLLES
jgi:hypothetical protein